MDCHRPHDDAPIEFADALAASRYGLPVLLVPTSGDLPASVADVVRDLAVERVVVVGGPKAVSEQMERQLTSV